MMKSIPMDRLPRRLTLQVLSDILEERGYQRGVDFMPLTGQKDIFEFRRGEEKIILTIDKKGEAQERLVIQGPEEELGEIIVELALRSTLPLYADLLGSIMEPENLENLLGEVEGMIRRSTHTPKTREDKHENR